MASTLRGHVEANRLAAIIAKVAAYSNRLDVAVGDRWFTYRAEFDSIEGFPTANLVVGIEEGLRRESDPAQRIPLYNAGIVVAQPLNALGIAGGWTWMPYSIVPSRDMNWLRRSAR